MGNLKIIYDSRIHSIIAKDPKYRFPAQIDFKSVAKKILRLLKIIEVIDVSESMWSVML